MGNNYRYNNKNHKKKKSFIDESYVPPYDKGLLGQSIDILKLSDVVKEKLLKGNVNTIFDVVRRCEKDFYRIPTFDKRNLGELKSALNNKRLRLKPMETSAPKVEDGEKKGENNAQNQKREVKSKENKKEVNVQVATQSNKENNRNQKKGNEKVQKDGRVNNNNQQKQVKFEKTEKKVR